MVEIARDELVLIRHAPADHGGRLCGRTDVAARLPDATALRPLKAALTGVTAISSPALRCRQTAGALFPDVTPQIDARLWEQDFGVQEGMAFADLPDLGPMALEDLARIRATGGESFVDMVARTEPALMDLFRQVQQSGPIAVVAHAGTARAALGLALGQPHLGLSFEIEPLSLTRLRCHAGGLSVVRTNERIVPQ